MTRIAVIQGHPTAGGGHSCHAPADAHAQGAAEGGHELRQVPVAKLEFPLLRSRSDWEKADLPPAIAGAQETTIWAEHLVIVYQLWLGAMPALPKGFLEQAHRPAFMTGEPDAGIDWKIVLKGRSARIVVTMGMPAPIYRRYFGARGLESLKRNILSFAGVRPNRHMPIGMIEGMSDARRKAWLETLRELGQKGR